MTNEEFLKRLDDVNKNIRPLEEYQGYHTKIKFQCLLDGNVWKNSPASIFQMHGCPKCAGKLSDELKSVSNVNSSHNNSSVVNNFYQTNNSPKSLSRLEIYRKKKKKVISGKIYFSGLTA